MQFKTKELQSEYRSRLLHKSLQEILLVLEILAHFYKKKMPDGITITSLHRPHNKTSYHSKWQAVDVRTRDWAQMFKHWIGIILNVVNRLDHKIQHVFEKDPEHLHIEYDDKSLDK